MNLILSVKTQGFPIMLKTPHASLLLLALGLVAVITSCEKKQEVPTVPEAPKV